MDSNVIVAIISAIAGIITGLVPHFLDKRKERKNKEEEIENKDQLYKFVYVKVIHLTRKKEGRSSVYEAFVKRLKKKVKVFDEYHYFRLNVFHTPQKEYYTENRSSGVVDLQILHPWQNNLQFTDQAAEKVEQYISQSIPGPSSVFFTKCIFYNGLQQENEDIGIKMEQNTDEARIIVDFSSLPNYERFLKERPTAVLRSKAPNLQDNKEISVHTDYPGFFSVRETNLKKEDVICMSFVFDWNVIDQPRQLEPV
ncbi:hypothetical protein GCM10027443_06400 [Pontibacter brevis]